MPVHVIVLTPSPLRGAAWRALLAEFHELGGVSAAADVDQLSSLVPVGAEATVLVDVPEPILHWAARLKIQPFHANALYLVQDFDLATVVSLLQAGAAGALAHDATVPDLARGLVAASRGELVLPAAMASRALIALARGLDPDTGPAETLSERETEILGHLALGQTNKDIAQALLISVRTVEAHVRNLFSKLGVRSRTEAALWAVRHSTESPA